MRNKSMKLTDDEYNKLSNYEKQQRVTNLVNTFINAVSGNISDRGINNNITRILNNLRVEDLKYMNEEEIEMFKEYGIIE